MKKKPKRYFHRPHGMECDYGDGLPEGIRGEWCRWEDVAAYVQLACDLELLLDENGDKLRLNAGNETASAAGEWTKKVATWDVGLRRSRDGKWVVVDDYDWPLEAIHALAEERRLVETEPTQ